MVLFLKVILHKASIVGAIFSDMQKDVFLIDIMACCNHSHPCYSHKSEAVKSSTSGQLTLLLVCDDEQTAKMCK